jgi:hypothetical protein
MAKTLANMRTSAKYYADMENSEAFTTAMWTEWINRGVEDLWDVLTRAGGADIFGKRATPITIVAGTSDYSLAADFHQLIGDWISDSSNVPQQRKVRKWGWEDEADLRLISGELTNLRRRIIHNGTNRVVSFLPVPTVGGKWNYSYIPKPTALSADGDTFDGLNGWEEYAEIVAAIKAKNKEETDPSGLIMDLNRIAAKIRSNMDNMDQSEGDGVRKVESDWDRASGIVNPWFSQ